LAAAGCVCGVFGLLTISGHNAWSRIFCGVGTILGVAILFGLGVWPLLFGPRAIADSGRSSSQPVVVPFGSTIAASQSEWLDASKGRVVQADLRVRFTDVAVEFIAIKGLAKKRQPKE